MTNYTEKLKNHWKSEDFTFIATFKKYTEGTGFFNDFTHPINRKKLFYPILDNIDLVKKSVSFYEKKTSKLIDKNYYKVELTHTNNPNGKNNPYSLSIKTITALD